MGKEEIVKLRAEPLTVIETFAELIAEMKQDKENKVAVALFEDVLSLAKVGVMNITPKPKEGEKDGK